MKILYVCHEPLPSPYTNTEQIVKTAAALAHAGIDVDVIAPRRPSEPADDRHPQKIAEFYGIPFDALDNGLRIIERVVPRAIRGNAIRPWHDVVASSFARGRGYDFVYTRDPFSLLTALAAHPRVIFETYRIDLNSRRRFAAWRHLCYRRAALLGIVAHSRMARDSFLKLGFDPGRVLVAHNGFAPEAMTPRLSSADARRRLGLPPDGPLVTYAGHVDGTKGLDELAAMARALPEVHFIVVGQMGKPRTVPRAPNIRMLPRVPPAQVAPYLFAADCLVIPPSAKPLRAHRRTVLPMKTFLYLATGRPIIGPDLPDLREILTPNHDAVLVEPDQPAAAAAALGALLADPGRQRELATNALTTSVRYTWQARADKIAAFLHDLLDRQ